MCTHARIAAPGRGALATLVAIVLSAIPAAPAGAGEYHVYSCRTPGGQAAPTDGWSEGVHSGEDVTLDTCQEAGGGLIAGMDAHAAHPADTDKATWSFSAPPNESISAAILWRAGETVTLKKPETAYAFWMAGVADAGPETEVFEECGPRKCAQEGDFAQPLSAENRIVVPSNALGSRYLYLNVSCAALVASCEAAEAGGTGYAAAIELFAADLTLSDTESPTVSAVKGALAEAASVGGDSDLEFHAGDGGSGVYEVVVKVDGNVLSTTTPDEAGGHCRDLGGTSDGLPAFLYTQPCSPSVSVDLPLDTTAIPNGSHHLLVSVLDASGNATPVVDRQIAVANADSPKGGTGEEPSGSGTGSGGGTGGGTNPGGGAGGGSTGGSTGGSSGAGPTGAGSGSGGIGGAGGAAASGSNAAPVSPLALGAANGTGASTQALLVAAWRGHRGGRLTGRYGAARTVEGRLTGPGGAPIAGAQIAVEALPAYAGSKPRTLATPRTTADGRWRLVLPRSIPSGQLRFSYAAHLGDPLPAATRTLALNVRAAVRLRVAPRIAPSDGAIRFSGRLLGGPIPAGGKQVVLEARSPGGRWVEFRVVRARSGAGGRFGFAYRFRLPGPARYEFRAVCQAEADYPFASGVSNVVGVVER